MRAGRGGGLAFGLHCHDEDDHVSKHPEAQFFVWRGSAGYLVRVDDGDTGAVSRGLVEEGRGWAGATYRVSLSDMVGVVVGARARARRGCFGGVDFDGWVRQENEHALQGGG